MLPHIYVIEYFSDYSIERKPIDTDCFRFRYLGFITEKDQIAICAEFYT